VLIPRRVKPVVRLEGKLCVFPGIPSLFQKMLTGLTPYLPLPPSHERPTRIQVFTELVFLLPTQTPSLAHPSPSSEPLRRPESMIAPYLTSLQTLLKPRGIQIGSYPVLGKGVFISLIGRELLGGATPPPQSASSASASTPSTMSTMDSTLSPCSSTFTPASSSPQPQPPPPPSPPPSSPPSPSSTISTLLSSFQPVTEADPYVVGGGNAASPSAGDPLQMNLMEIARKLEIEVGGCIVSEEDVVKCKERGYFPATRDSRLTANPKTKRNL
jgi:hypothetical protein